MSTRFAIAAVVAALVVGGCGSSSSGVSPSAYVKSFCTALQSFKQDVTSAQSQAQASMAGAKSVAEVKQKLQPFAATLVAALDRLTVAIKAAGTPAVPGGKDLSNQFVAAFGQFRSAFVQAQSLYAQLPTDSLSSFQAAAAGANAQLKQSVAQVKSGLNLKSNSQLRAAAVKDPTCQAVKATS